MPNWGPGDTQKKTPNSILCTRKGRRDREGGTKEMARLTSFSQKKGKVFLAAGVGKQGSRQEAGCVSAGA